MDVAGLVYDPRRDAEQDVVAVLFANALAIKVGLTAEEYQEAPQKLREAARDRTRND